MQSVIVTGLSGLVGSGLQRAADSAGVQIVGMDRTHGVDLLDAAAVARFVREQQAHAPVRAIVHLAAYTNVSAAHAQQGDESGPCYQLNVVGTRNVVQAAREAGVFLAHVSTDFVFPGDKQEPYSEADAPRPIEWYGETKLRAEEIVQGYAAGVIARIAFPYAAGQAPRLDVVRTILGKLRAGDALKLFSDQIVTPTLVDDIAAGLLALVREQPAGELFHLVGAESTSPYELGRLIADIFELSDEKIEATRLADYLKVDPRPRQQCLRIDNDKWTRWARERDIEPPLGVEAGLQQVRQSLT